MELHQEEGILCIANRKGGVQVFNLKTLEVNELAIKNSQFRKTARQIRDANSKFQIKEW